LVSLPVFMENWTGRTGRHKSTFFFEYNKLYKLGA
jgi:hypothetical protein